MVQLHQHKEAIEALGAQLVVIGNGAPNFIEGFKTHVNYTGALYTNPSLEFYTALNFRRSVFSSLHPKSFSKGATAWGEGFRQGKTRGDPWQQGGVLVVDNNANVLFVYRSQHAGDHPEISDVLAALQPSD